MLNNSWMSQMEGEREIGSKGRGNAQRDSQPILRGQAREEEPQERK